MDLLLFVAVAVCIWMMIRVQRRCKALENWIHDMQALAAAQCEELDGR